jgi:hypothetical protein
MTSTRSSTSVSRRLRWAGALLLGFMMAAGVFELALRAMAASPWWRVLPTVSTQFDGPDAELGYAHRPNVEGLWVRENRALVRINAQGLRDRPRSNAAEPGTMRIAIAGDSITEALQVDESDLFTLRTEEKLRRMSKNVEVLNFGLSGALPLQQLLFVRSRGLPIGVDAAVFIFSAADFLNPLMRNDHFLPAYVDTPSGDVAVGRSYLERRSHRLAETWVGQTFFWIVDHSLVANAIYTRLKLRLLPDLPTGVTSAAARNVCAELRDNLDAQSRLWGAGEPAWAARRVNRFLSDVPKLLEGRPAVFMLSGFGSPTTRCPAEMQIRAEVVSRARSIIESRGIHFVDLESAILEKMPDENGFHRLGGFGARLGYGHLNPWGHEIYAQVLTEVLASKMLQDPGNAGR